MADITFSEVLRLVEQLNPEEQQALEQHLQHLARQRELSVAEKKKLFDSLIVDVGRVLPGYSDRREDWYDERG